MTNMEKYNEAFTSTFGIGEDALESLEYQGIAAWDSVGHMQLIAALASDWRRPVSLSEKNEVISSTKRMRNANAPITSTHTASNT